MEVYEYLMVPVDLIVEPEVEPFASVAVDRYLMRQMSKRGRARNAVLRIYGGTGDSLLLGRYHLAPRASESMEIRVGRRLCGGRALPFGAGYIGLSLILPHRSALLSPDPHALAAYQVLNRYVRGIMEACRTVRLLAYYPGRDTLTVDRRVLAAISLETDEQGVALFEAVIAHKRDFSTLPQFLETADPGGAVKTEVTSPDSMTSLCRELSGELSFDEAADLLQRGFARQLGLTIEPRPLSVLERQAIEAAAKDWGPEDWVHERERRPELDCHASVWAKLGCFEAHFAVQQDRFIKNILFTGDFIANSPAIRELEHRLRLCPLEWKAIDTVTGEVFAKPQNFLLGVGELRIVADMIMRSVSR